LSGRGERGKEERIEPVHNPAKHGVGHDPVAVAGEENADVPHQSEQRTVATIPLKFMLPCSADFNKGSLLSVIDKAYMYFA
jgi:hypothetical protein